MGDTSVFQNLKDTFSQKHEEIKNKLIQRHGNAITKIATYPVQAGAGMMGALILATNTLPAVPQQALTVKEDSSAQIKPYVFLISDLKNLLPQDVRALDSHEEKIISETLSRSFDMKVTPELEGIRLNRSYGYIGAEQHLARYPGDSMATHFDNAQDSQKYYSSGMAPGLGAWGYFVNSKYDLTQKDIDREKYYIATQTFLAPGFHDNVGRYIKFFKYRKMLVVNPENGRAMVVIIGDAGPGASTGKHLGGSPEVMKYLERKDGKQKGPVLYFFIDDPEDTVPLGPIGPR